MAAKAATAGHLTRSSEIVALFRVQIILFTRSHSLHFFRSSQTSSRQWACELIKGFHFSFSICVMKLIFTSNSTFQESISISATSLKKLQLKLFDVVSCDERRRKASVTESWLWCFKWLILVINYILLWMGWEYLESESDEHWTLFYTIFTLHWQEERDCSMPGLDDQQSNLFIVGCEDVKESLNFFHYIWTCDVNHKSSISNMFQNVISHYSRWLTTDWLGRESNEKIFQRIKMNLIS